MKVALVHYWWLTNRGGEAVIAAILKIFPDADLYLHVSDDKLIRQTLGNEFTGNIYNTKISKFFKAKKYYQKYLPFMPIALEQLDLMSYDLVISSESGPAKGVITRPDTIHICYCHSPMRYIWDMYFIYLSQAGLFVKFLFPLISHWLRVWDRVSADRVDFFIANSKFVSNRINKYYHRESEVIFPPVSTDLFEYTRPREDYYLYLGQLVSYKSVDMAVKVFNNLNLPLLIIGEGEMTDKLKSLAKTNVKFLGRQPFNVVKYHLERCKALIFPGVEDFGIVPVEAMASGAPVIAYGYGGVLETVIHRVTGILYKNNNESDLMDAVMLLENSEVQFDPKVLHEHALNFDKNVFSAKFREFVQNKIFLKDASFSIDL